MTKAYFNWSGGKDSALCLHQVLKEKVHHIQYLVTTLSQKHQRISMHGVREKLLDQQAVFIGLPLKKIWLSEMPSMRAYDETMRHEMQELREQGIDQETSFWKT